ncbi:hypothetical protein [Photorhabdus khanii]|uniref:hypothetical protein n=1 Tax=Photorhabdus khanii TaxID=1004150 RepID=UPI0018655680|nr:hypothetical protein [Photorhabdus khanii]
MSVVGQREKATQDRLISFFQRDLGYRYLGNWQDRDDNKNIDIGLLTKWGVKK